MQIQEHEIMDERKRLERLIALMPIGKWRAQYEAQLIKLNFALPGTRDAHLESLRAQHNEVSAEWNRLFDQLEMMDQNTPEFDSRFAEWEKVDEHYKRLWDQIALAESSAHIRQSMSMPMANSEGP